MLVYNPLLLKIQQMARNYLGRKNVMNEAPRVRGYEAEEREFISGRIIDDELSIIPATENQKKILKYANLIEQDDLNSPYNKTFILRDKDTGNLRGAISISQYHYDEDEEEDEEDKWDERFDKLFTLDDDEEEEEEDDDFDVDEDESKPKVTVVKYYDVSPDGSNVERAIKKIIETPHGYCMKTSAVKIIKQSVNESFLKKFIE